MEKLLRLRDVQDATGLKRSAIYANIARGRFPAPVLIGERAVAWHESKIQDWIQQRPLAQAVNSKASKEANLDGSAKSPTILHPGALGTVQ